ncbi:quinone oxidoreductase family protein [Thermostaphylospora chromogena]|uniref:NADPH2:quinone reductase n=1 Tax=Thermostaphylospora chromogena TaxID=35622 RepID=A0A1H1I814_9ACTN|nr:quinone oxidoreductase [Thermostaphylospora chromogena]SDR33498.1 NADPH2:quinone reductase [Thermostaphylospora chromogena]
MRAVVVSATGGPEVLEYTERPDPAPGSGEVLVEVAAAGVNFIDTYHREGRYPLPLPFVIGLEGAGRVIEVGDGVTGLSVGDVVAWTDGLGSYAERVVLPAGRVVPVPQGVTAEQAAAAALQGMTAHYLIHDVHPVRPGDTVLVHAAAGGMGLLLTQMAKLRGARVIGTVSTDEKEEIARRAGADEVVRYDGFAEKVRELTDGVGVDVVYDGVGKATFEGSLDSLRRRGMMALYGGASGPVPPLDPMTLNAKGSLFLTRPKLNDYIVEREELLRRASDVFGWIASGDLKINISHRYPLGDARQAHEDLQARRTTGKLLLIP